MLNCLFSVTLFHNRFKHYSGEVKNYPFRFIFPLAGSGFNKSIINDFLVAGGDELFDIVLVPSEVTLGGIVYMPDGVEPLCIYWPASPKALF